MARHSGSHARLAQRESASLTRKRSLVQSQYRAPAPSGVRSTVCRSNVCRSTVRRVSRAISSAGERFPDTEEVTGSIPVSRTSPPGDLSVPPRAISSAGERFPDTEEVTGSIPVSRTAVEGPSDCGRALFVMPCTCVAWCAASAPGLPSPTVRTRRRSLRGTGQRWTQCWMRCSTEVACTVNCDQPPKAKASSAATGSAIARAISGFLVSLVRARSDWRRRRTDPPLAVPPVYTDMAWFPLSSAAASSSSAGGLDRWLVAVGGVPRGTSCPPTAGTNLRSAPLAGRHAPGPSLRHPEGGRSSPGTTTGGGGPVPRLSGSPLTAARRGR